MQYAPGLHWYSTGPTKGIQVFSSEILWDEGPGTTYQKPLKELKKSPIPKSTVILMLFLLFRYNF